MKNESYIYAGDKAQELTKYSLAFKMKDTNTRTSRKTDF